MALASLALLAICYGLVEGQRYDWGTVTSFISIPLIIGAGVVLLAVFLLVQKLRQDREPLIPFALFRNRNFTLMNWVSVHAVHRDARHLPAVHHLPAVRAGLLRAEGGADPGALLAGDDHRRARSSAG